MKLLLIILSSMLGACANQVTLPTGEKMDSDTFVEATRIKENAAIANKHQEIIQTNNQATTSAMLEPAVFIQFSSMGCDKMPNGVCTFATRNPITTEMIKAQSDGLSAQLATLPQIKGPTNAADVGVAMFGTVESGVKVLGDVLNKNGAIIGMGAIAVKGFDKLASVAIAATPSNTTTINDSSQNNVTTSTETSSVDSSLTAGESIATAGSTIRQDSDDITVAIDGGVKVNSDNPVTTSNDSNDNNSVTTTEIEKTPPTPVIE